MENDLTQRELKKLINYDKDTGVITRRVSISNGVKPGDAVGSKRSDGYLSACIGSKSYLCHRIIWLYMEGYMPEQIDHINHIRADNRFANLRNVSAVDNCKNQKARKTNTSGIMGVSYDKKNKKWRSKIQVDFKTICLGRYETKSEAESVRINANNQYGYHARS